MYAIIVQLLQPYLFFMLLQLLALGALWFRRERRTLALVVLTAAFAGQYLLSTRAVAYKCAAALERPYPPLVERPAEVAAATGLSSEEVDTALRRVGLKDAPLPRRRAGSGSSSA